MSRLFLHPPSAEDQPYPHLILTTHVLHRGFQVGALLGSTAGISYSTYRYLRPPITTTPTPSEAAAATPRPPLRQTLRSLFLPNVLRFTGIGSLCGIGVLALGLSGRMRGREEIEWQDRAWRLLENEGQLSVDDWSLDGMVLGVALALWGVSRGFVVVPKRMAGRRVLSVVGAAGLGSLAGTEGSVEWRALSGRKEKERVPVGRGEKRLLDE